MNAGGDADADAGAGADFAIVIMAKAPIAGLAKTRLIPLLGAAGAARAQRGFLLRTLATAAAAHPGLLTLSCTPDPAQRFFRALRRSSRWPGLQFASQCEGDIGTRMAAVFAEHADRSGKPHSESERPRPPVPALLIGTDCPALSPTHLQHAAVALAQGADVVFIPVEDGGYMLVGLRDPAAAVRLRLFDGIDWSTDRVMPQTRAQLRAAGARWHELPLLWDVDEPADWLRWQQVQQRDP